MGHCCTNCREYSWLLYAGWALGLPDGAYCTKCKWELLESDPKAMKFYRARQSSLWR